LLPTKQVIGSVSGFALGTAVVCGGARTTYASCTKKAVGTYCSRNAECIKTAGGSLWCTGPKVNACYIYDRYKGKNWILSPHTLLVARAYAASVMLPDGTLWILGGAGQNTILITTEFVSLSENDIQAISLGPDMVEPLFGHCAALITNSQVVVVGGFSSVLNDYTPNVHMFDLNTKSWDRKRSMTVGPRMDSSCLNVYIEGDRQVLLIGGWNISAISGVATFSKYDYRWSFISGGSNDPYIRSSFLLKRNQKPFVVGGVECSKTGAECKQSSKGEPYICFVDM